LKLKVFPAHSYIGALPLHIIEEYFSTIYFKAGDWTNADTLLNHYYAHASNTPVCQILLNESPLKG